MCVPHILSQHAITHTSAWSSTPPPPRAIRKNVCLLCKLHIWKHNKSLKELFRKVPFPCDNNLPARSFVPPEFSTDDVSKSCSNLVFDAEWVVFLFTKGSWKGSLKNNSVFTLTIFESGVVSDGAGALGSMNGLQNDHFTPHQDKLAYPGSSVCAATVGATFSLELQACYHMRGPVTSKKNVTPERFHHLKLQKDKFDSSLTELSEFRNRSCRR